MAAPYPLIAACVDGGPADARVVAEAGALAEPEGARLVLVHVASVPAELGEGIDASWIGVSVSPDPTPFLEAGRARLESASALAPDAEAVLLDGGDPGAAVCDWAAERGVDLIVAGAHRGRVERLTLGSFAGFVAHNAPCPVLLVRPIPHR